MSADARQSPGEGATAQDSNQLDAKPTRFGDWCPDRGCAPDPVRYPAYINDRGDAYYKCHKCGATWRCSWQIDPRPRMALGAYRRVQLPMIPRMGPARLSWLDALDNAITEDTFRTCEDLYDQGLDVEAVRQTAKGLADYLGTRIRTAADDAADLWADT